MAPSQPPDRTWLRFAEAGRTGLFPPYTVDSRGHYRCQDCDALLEHRGRQCRRHMCARKALRHKRFGLKL